MSQSQSFGNLLSRLSLASSGARSYAKELPKEAAGAADKLEKQHVDPMTTLESTAPA